MAKARKAMVGMGIDPKLDPKHQLEGVVVPEVTLEFGDDAPERSQSGMLLIPGMKLEQLNTLVIGESPLICNQFSHKMRQKVLAKHTGEASAGREKKVPEENFQAARYRLPDGSDGVPASGLKAGIVDGFGRDVGVPLTKAKGAIRVLADDVSTNLVRILTPTEPRMREDVVRNETGVVDIRHRPEYWPWALYLRIQFTPAFFSHKQLLQAISRSGFLIGQCEWRPGAPKSKSGSFGTFRVASMEEAIAFENGELFGHCGHPLVNMAA